MRKPQTPNPQVTDEESAFEVIELASDELQSLSKVFNMLNALCAELADEAAQERISEAQVH